MDSQKDSLIPLLGLIPLMGQWPRGPSTSLESPLSDGQLHDESLLLEQAIVVEHVAMTTMVKCDSLGTIPLSRYFKAERCIWYIFH